MRKIWNYFTDDAFAFERNEIEFERDYQATQVAFLKEQWRKLDLEQFRGTDAPPAGPNTDSRKRSHMSELRTRLLALHDADPSAEYDPYK